MYYRKIKLPLFCFFLKYYCFLVSVFTIQNLIYLSLGGPGSVSVVEAEMGHQGAGRRGMNPSALPQCLTPLPPGFCLDGMYKYVYKNINNIV